MNSLKTWSERLELRLLAAAVIGLIGVVLFILFSESQGRVPFFLRTLGSSLMIAMIVAVTIDLLLQEELLRRVWRTLRNVDESLTRLGIINQAADAGITTIFSTRSECLESIRSFLATGKGEIRVLCVAAPRFFRPDSSLLKDLVGETQPGGQGNTGFLERNDANKLSVLLLASNSQWAQIRGAIEHPHDTIGDIQNAERFLRWLEQEYPTQVKCRTYDLPPFDFLVLTEEGAFLEPYPLRIPPVNFGAPALGMLGGNTPSVHLHIGSKAYKTWEDMFTAVWDHPNISWWEEKGRSWWEWYRGQRLGQ